MRRELLEVSLRYLPYSSQVLSERSGQYAYRGPPGGGEVTVVQPGQTHDLQLVLLPFVAVAAAAVEATVRFPILTCLNYRTLRQPGHASALASRWTVERRAPGWLGAYGRTSLRSLEDTVSYRKLTSDTIILQPDTLYPEFALSPHELAVLSEAVKGVRGISRHFRNSNKFEFASPHLSPPERCARVPCEQPAAAG